MIVSYSRFIRDGFLDQMMFLPLIINKFIYRYNYFHDKKELWMYYSNTLKTRSCSELKSVLCFECCKQLWLNVLKAKQNISQGTKWNNWQEFLIQSSLVNHCACVFIFRLLALLITSWKTVTYLSCYFLWKVSAIVALRWILVLLHCI